MTQSLSAEDSTNSIIPIKPDQEMNNTMKEAQTEHLHDKAIFMHERKEHHFALAFQVIIINISNVWNVSGIHQFNNEFYVFQRGVADCMPIPPDGTLHQLMHTDKEVHTHTHSLTHTHTESITFTTNQFL